MLSIQASGQALHELQHGNSDCLATTSELSLDVLYSWKLDPAILDIPADLVDPGLDHV